jgi:aryl-alcohol dehydrogenase-like predicted oxidoreductase
VGEEFARYAVFEKLVRPGRTMAQVALRYVLDEATTHTVILGAKSVEDYRVAVGATEMAGLEDGERKMIGELRAAL